VPPERPPEAQLPNRPKVILLTIGCTLLGWIVLRVIIAAIRDHMV
jgi:hypothetical protein